MAEFQSDEDLLALITQGSRAAFRTAFDRYHNELQVFLRRMTGNLQHAEDICQEVFITLWRASGDVTSSLRGWLYQVARRRAIDFSRRGLVRLTAFGRIAAQAAEQATPSPEDALLVQEQVEWLRSFLSTLPDTHRHAVRLFYTDGLSLAEIGERLGRTENAIKCLLHDVRTKIEGAFIARFGNGGPT